MADPVAGEIEELSGAACEAFAPPNAVKVTASFPGMHALAAKSSTV